MKKEYFRKKLDEATVNEEQYRKKSNQFSIGRLFSFLIVLLFLVLWIISSKLIYGIIALITLILFIVLIIIHNQVFEKKKYYQFLIQTLNEYLARFDSDWQDFSCSGIDNNTENEFLEDLDIIGEVSLFKYLNICKSRKAVMKLKERLSNPEPNDLGKRQLEMVEIAGNVDFSLDFQVSLKAYDEKTPKLNLTELIKSHLSLKIPKFYWWLMISQCLVTIIVLVLSLSQVISWNYFITIFILQLLGSFLYVYLFRYWFTDIELTLPAISLLAPLFKVILKAQFTNEELKAYQEKISQALKSLKTIEGLVSLDSVRKNFVGSMLNGLLPLNLYIIHRYQTFIQTEAKKIIESIETIEDLEVLVSLAIIGQVKEKVILPTLTKEMTLAFDNVKHPLLKEEECIPNSFAISNHINIITGSNMSGKTSFLRIIGINLILMYAGAYVTADSFSAPYLKIFTSMRVKDDLVKGISTFYAELLRIKKAIDYAGGGRPMIILIDEIFKGTNALDRIAGALSMIERLQLPNVILFITTHDLEICQVKNIPVSNYHFSEHYEGEKIKFDYKLKNGICLTTNASYLMKLTGIIRGE